MHARLYKNAEQCLTDYGLKRTYDGKGVTIPSQRRYVNYYENKLQFGRPYKRTALQVKGQLRVRTMRFSVITPPPPGNILDCRATDVIGTASQHARVARPSEHLVFVGHKRDMPVHRRVARSQAYAECGRPAGHSAGAKYAAGR